MIPKKIKQYALRALKVSTRVLSLLNSGVARNIISMLGLPPEFNDLIGAVEKIVSKLHSIILAASNEEEKKVIAGAVGTYITSHLDGFKLKNQDYRNIFESVFYEQKMIGNLKHL